METGVVELKHYRQYVFYPQKIPDETDLEDPFDEIVDWEAAVFDIDFHTLVHDVSMVGKV